MDKTNGVGHAQGGGFHRLPQIPTMSRNVKIAQSKMSAKLESTEMETQKEEAVLLVEGTDTVVKIGSDGSAQTTNAPLSEPCKDKSDEGSVGEEPINNQITGESEITIKKPKKLPKSKIKEESEKNISTLRGSGKRCTKKARVQEKGKGTDADEIPDIPVENTFPNSDTVSKISRQRLSKCDELNMVPRNFKKSCLSSGQTKGNLQEDENSNKESLPKEKTMNSKKRKRATDDDDVKDSDFSLKCNAQSQRCQNNLANSEEHDTGGQRVFIKSEVLTEADTENVMHGESAQTLATDTDKSVSNNRKSRKRIIKIENTEETDQQLLLKTSISEVLEVKEAINNVMVRDESVEKVQQSPNSSDDVRQDESESNKSVVDLLPKDLQTAQMKEQVLQSQAETKEMEGSNGIEDTKCSSDMAACETKDGSASESVKSGPVNNRIGLKVYMSAAGTVLPRTVLLRESERPSDSQLARVREGNTQEFDALHPVKWHIGDLLWGHVSGHPWWPGMVSSDPFSGLFTTIKRGPGLTRMYHVQYFGDEAERGWVNEKSALPFDGKQKLVEYGKEQVRLVKGRANKTKLLQSFCPNPRRKAAWEIAVAESEDAATLDKTERIDKYTFVYEFLPNRKPGVGQKSNVKGGNVSSRGTDRGLKRKSEGDLVIERTTKDLSGSELKFKSSAAVGSFAHVGGQEEGSFRTFCIKHSETFLQEHPDYSSIMVMQDLHQQWTMMSPQQRLRYKSKVSKASSESTDVDGITSGRL